MNAVIDLDNVPERNRLLAWIEKLTGRWRFECVRFRPRRTDRQNAYYWPCFVEPFAAWCCENWGEPITPLAAHEFLKARFNKVEVLDKSTGELFTRVASTTDLTTVEFNRYLDRCAQFLAEYCHIYVPPPRT